MLLSLQTYQPQSLSPRCGVTLSRFTWYLHGIEYSWPMGSGTTRRCGHVGISRVVGPLSTLPQGMEIGQPRHSNLCQDVLGHKVATGHCSGDREAQSENRTVRAGLEVSGLVTRLRRSSSHVLGHPCTAGSSERAENTVRAYSRV